MTAKGALMGRKYRNETIKTLLDQDAITRAEYKQLFEEKEGYTEEQEQLFDVTFQKVIDLQAQETTLNLEMIQFPRFYVQHYRFPEAVPYSFSHAIFSKKAHFEEATFSHEMNFEGATFRDKAYFRDSVFAGEAIFTSTTFLEKVYFRRAIFKRAAYYLSTSFIEKADFRDVVFADKALFRGAVCKDLIQFSGAQITRLDLETSRFADASYLHLHGYEASGGKPVLLSGKHFPNKESARHIKAHFEKQNNITEANKYFVIEQSLYLKELKSEDWWSHKGTIFTVALHRWVSNSGTSWIKVLFWIILFALAVLVLYDGIPHDTETILNIPDRAIELVNPLNIFKRGYNLYEGHEFWAMLVRVVATYLIYQFMMAFRQDTRRK
jgi:uncharacterized protein YjbI with pentapeptide repeats